MTVLILDVCGAVYGQSPRQDAARPTVPPRVQQLLERAKSQPRTERAAALADVEQALQIARDTTDAAGVATALELDAELRDDGRSEAETRAAWELIERNWSQVGYRPGQIKAIGRQAELRLSNDPAASVALVDRALVLAEGERQWPRAVAVSLLQLGVAFAAKQSWSLATRALEEGLARGAQIVPSEPDTTTPGPDVLLARQPDADVAVRLSLRALHMAEALTDDPSPVVSPAATLAITLRDQREFRAALRVHQDLIAVLEHHPRWPQEWLGSFIKGAGDMAFSAEQWPLARDYYARALAIEQPRDPDSEYAARLLRLLARTAQETGDHAAVRDYARHAVSILERVAPASADMARLLTILGNEAKNQNEPDAARQYMTRALEIRERLAPASLDVVEVLGFLGMIEAEDGAPTTARRHYERALTILQTTPDEKFEELTLAMLRSAAWQEGDLKAAREYAERSVALRQQIEPDSAALATRLNLLGGIAREMSDFESARRYHQRALAISERLAPDSLEVAGALSFLGQVASLAGDRVAARDDHERAYAIRSRLAPDSSDVATSLQALASLAEQDGDRATARRYRERALAIEEHVAPDSYGVASSLNDLAGSALGDGDLDTASRLMQRSLAITEKIRPNSMAVAEVQQNLGSVALAAGRLADAEALYSRALALEEKLEPDSVNTAISLTGLAQVRSRSGDVGAAEPYAERAWRVVRMHAKKISGDEAKRAFSVKYTWAAARLIDVQVANGRPDAAFATLEESRSQSLLLLLASRGLAQRLAPVDLWHRYAQAQATVDQATRAVEQNASAADAARAVLADRGAGTPTLEARQRAVATLTARTTEARRVETQARVAVEDAWSAVIKAIEPALPAPISAADARALLPPGTVVAAFSATEFGYFLFLVEPDRPVRAWRLGISAAEIASSVDLVIGGVTRDVSQRGPPTVARGSARADTARRLFHELFPAEARTVIMNAKTAVISPDADLWNLPFAALVTNDLGPLEYLGLQVPLAYTQSLAVYAQTERERKHRATLVDQIERADGISSPGAPMTRAIVVGNPLYDNARRQQVVSSTLAGSARPSAALDRPNRAAPSNAPGELGTLSRDGAAPEPLPYAEEEATDVAALYGTTPATGVQPTEPWFRDGAVDAAVIHLATHGYFNPQRAMSSGVRLAVPESEDDAARADRDGALQAWEVMQLRLAADLVVLSACQTGRGESVGGEGLIGLTRAFQVAGVASIVATQWSVADRSTATAMVAFHRELLKGVPKNLALQTAMREVASNPATADPYYWAPFVLVGDSGPLRRSTNAGR